MEKRGDTIDECHDLMAMFMKEVSKRKNDKDPHFFTQKQCSFLLSDLFGAGVETSVNTLRWFLLYMALNKDIQVNKHNFFIITRSFDVFMILHIIIQLIINVVHKIYSAWIPNYYKLLLSCFNIECKSIYRFTVLSYVYVHIKITVIYL